jgi:hypothetical protein
VVASVTSFALSDCVLATCGKIHSIRHYTELSFDTLKWIIKYRMSNSQHKMFSLGRGST